MASACAIKADARNPSSWRNLHRMLKMVSSNVTCVVCGKLFSLNNDCVTCELNIRTNPEVSFVNCYQSLCEFIASLEVYHVMCTRPEDTELVDLLRTGKYSLF